jgi:hypothetical protein
MAQAGDSTASPLGKKGSELTLLTLRRERSGEKGQFSLLTQSGVRIQNDRPILFSEASRGSVILRRKSPFARARSFASTVNMPCEYTSPGAPKFPISNDLCGSEPRSSGVSRLEYGHDARVLQIA